MAQFERFGVGVWHNYHRNIARMVTDRLGIDDQEDRGKDAAGYFIATRRAYQALLADIERNGADIRPLGAGWTFSDAVRPSGQIVHTMAEASTQPRWQGAGAIFAVEAAQLRPPASATPRRYVLAAGGARIRDLNAWLDGCHPPLSLRTSGASDGQSIAGAIATGVHGSVPTLGGIQDHVCGIHLVTGADRSVWLEHPDRPVLSDSFALGFADEVRRHADQFEAAMSHLGGLGYVNAVLLDCAETFMLEVIQAKHIVGRDGLAELAAGDFRAFCQRVTGIDDEPYFLQVIVNPFHPFDSEALCRLYALHRPEALIEKGNIFEQLFKKATASALSFGDPISLLTTFFAANPRLRGPGIALLMSTAFPEQPSNRTNPRLVRWSATLSPPAEFGRLFSASFAVPRGRLLDALDVMLPAFQRNDGGDLVFTLRFVKRSSGLLSFTRFEDNVVIDLDGFWSTASQYAYDRVHRAMATSGIPFGQHPGKIGRIDKTSMVADFGDKLLRWKDARRALLAPGLIDHFGGRALSDWGMMD